MRKTFTCLVALSMTLFVFAQSPQRMSYQCVVRNATGALVINQSVGIRISILQGTITGKVVYQETYNPNPQTNANGLLSLEIGGGLAISGTFSEIDWSSGPYFLKTETDPTGGTNYSIIGTSQLLSVPYAMYAKTAGNSFSGNYYDLTNKPILFSGNYNDLNNLPILFNGMWGSLTGKPNTLSGYGIIDAMSTSHVANGITSLMVTNWNMAFSWGNPAGLYRPISYVPSWSEIKSKPATLAGYGITDAVNITDDQTIAGNKAFTGTINARTHTITNVGNPVSAQDAATKDYVDAMQTQITMLKNTLKAGGIVTDIDGNPYNTVIIGTQTWMAENLKTTKYTNGMAIPMVIDGTVWMNLTSSGYCWFNNDELLYKKFYGALYNWYAVNLGNLCPAGWHVPTLTEWEILSTYLGGDNIAGGKMKETGTTHWASPNTGADNSSGFTALPGGSRDNSGIFFTEGSPGYWWSYIERVGTSFAWAVSISYNYSSFTSGNSYNKASGFSVRCVKDN
jgi:uncharacterized protein (TIGR02145 family)